jgi:hypothetical protein
VAQHHADSEVILSDDTGTVTVTVPRGWAASSATSAWQPPGQEATFPGLSSGSSAGWTDSSSAGEGVFVGIMAGDALPAEIPGHPECTGQQSRTEDERNGDALVTVVYTGCPGVMVERVVRLTPTRLLWVQVRSAEQPVANRVLDSIVTHGV